jgi:hypothetical protein
MNVRTLCLSILYEGEATGYDIRRLCMEGEFAYFVEASFGSIYPALAKLEDEGLVTSRTSGKTYSAAHSYCWHVLSASCRMISSSSGRLSSSTDWPRAENGLTMSAPRTNAARPIAGYSIMAVQYWELRSNTCAPICTN